MELEYCRCSDSMHEAGCADVVEQNRSYLARGDEVSPRIESVSPLGVLDAKSQTGVWLLNARNLHKWGTDNLPGTETCISEEQITSQAQTPAQVGHR